MKKEYVRIENDKITELEWLLPKIRDIWQIILSFETIFEEVPNVKVDLKFLISLESQGY
jgi:hypothetical protein